MKKTANETLDGAKATAKVAKVGSKRTSAFIEEILQEIRDGKAARRKQYELLYLVPARYTEEELQPVKDKVAALVKEHGGTITSENFLGKKKLAYAIKHVHHGYYVLLNVEMPAMKVNALNLRLEHLPEVLRHLTVDIIPDQYAPKNVSKRKAEKKEEAVEAKEEKKAEEEVAA